MKKDIAIRWVEALRSGNYGQASFRLKDDDKYCCLGVLCEITQDQHAWRFRENTLILDEQAEYEVLPLLLREAFGITSNQQDDFTLMNDDTGLSFVQIADYIQAKFIDETFDGGPDAWCAENQIGPYATEFDDATEP